MDERPIVALVAGSRRGEIRDNLPLMARLSERFPGHQFVVTAVPWLERSLYKQYMAGSDLPSAVGSVSRRASSASTSGLPSKIGSMPLRLRNLRTIKRQMRECQADVAAFAPDVLILVDYPGFNMKMARWAKEHEKLRCRSGQNFSAGARNYGRNSFGNPPRFLIFHSSFFIFQKV